MGTSSRLERRFGLEHKLPFAGDLKKAVDAVVSSLTGHGFKVRGEPVYSARIHYFPATPAYDAPIFAYLEFMVCLRIGSKPAAVYRPAVPDGRPPVSLFEHSGALVCPRADSTIELFFRFRTTGDLHPPSSARTVDAVQTLREQILSWIREFESRIHHG
ncbi:MAG: hypothetical protein QJR01_03820 [Kyrpidia sp.]|nr:hypothetical protein [Kyrpidia sp.]